MANYGGAANYNTGSASVTQVVNTTLPQCCCWPHNPSTQSSRNLSRNPEVE
jgi:hypothetical protein